MIPAQPKLAKRARLRWDERDQKYILLYPERGLSLNASGAEILKLCDGSRTVEQIIDALSNGTNRDVVDSDVRAFLDRLIEKKLIE